MPDAAHRWHCAPGDAVLWLGLKEGTSVGQRVQTARPHAPLRPLLQWPMLSGHGLASRRGPRCHRAWSPGPQPGRGRGQLTRTASSEGRNPPRRGWGTSPQDSDAPLLPALPVSGFDDSLRSSEIPVPVSAPRRTRLGPWKESWRRGAEGSSPELGRRRGPGGPGQLGCEGRAGRIRPGSESQPWEAPALVLAPQTWDSQAVTTQLAGDRAGGDAGLLAAAPGPPGRALTTRAGHGAAGMAQTLVPTVGHSARPAWGPPR